MTSRKHRIVAAAAAAAMACVLSGTTSAVADGGTPGPSPLPAPGPASLPALGTALGTASGPASGPVPGDPGFGAVAGDLVSPYFDEIRVAAALSVENHGPVPVTALEPGGGSSGSPTPWHRKADLRVPTAAPAPSGAAGSAALSKDQVIWAAYTSAAAKEGSCHLPVMLLAAIGEVESSSLRGRSLSASHDAVPPVIGPALSGGSFAAMRDTDHGMWDGDPVWDHAVGPMQFIPATWRLWGADGNGDGVKDPQNIEDAALAAAGYLCAGGRDLSRPADLQAAVLSYNHSAQYLATVLGIVQAVDSGQVAGP